MKNNNKPTEKNFGITFGTIFFIIASYFFYKDIQFNLIVLIFFFLSVLFLLFSFIAPRVFFIPNIIWFYFGLGLQKLFTPLIIFLLFFFGIGITSIFYRIFHKKKINKKVKSRWIKVSSNDKKIDFANQF